LHHSGDLLDCQSAVISLAFSHITTAPLLEHPTLNTKESDRADHLYPDEWRQINTITFLRRHHGELPVPKGEVF
jgi:hypothetical protein